MYERDVIEDLKELVDNQVCSSVYCGVPAHTLPPPPWHTQHGRRYCRCRPPLTFSLFIREEREPMA